MRGIILAGGEGTRLRPLTSVTSKQLLPVFNRQLILYPLSTLIAMGVTEVLIITKSKHLDSYEDVLIPATPSHVKLRFAVQEEANGIAESLLIGKDFLQGHPCLLILGDNIFHGDEFLNYVSEIEENPDHAHAFAKKVDSPNRYGIVELGESGEVLSIQEKPPVARSDLALTGIYYLPSDASQFAKKLEKSPRGEFEITDLLVMYNSLGRLKVRNLGASVAWFDTGTHEDLLDAANYVRIVENRTASMFGFMPYLFPVA